MTTETEYLLNEFREQQKELFDKDGKAFRRLTHVEPMSRMLELINALEKELPKRKHYSFMELSAKYQSDFDKYQKENNSKVPEWWAGMATVSMNAVNDIDATLTALNSGNILHDFFNHKSDANQWLDATAQEQLEREFQQWLANKIGY